jgi:hypothetical protein
MNPGEKDSIISKGEHVALLYPVVVVSLDEGPEILEEEQIYLQER